MTSHGTFTAGSQNRAKPQNRKMVTARRTVMVMAGSASWRSILTVPEEVEASHLHLTNEETEAYGS